MRFNVSQLLKDSVGSRRSYPLDETFDALQETGTSRVRGQVTLTRTDVGVWISGPIEANAFSTCSRCLNPAECPVHFGIDEEYLTTVDIAGGGAITVPEVEEGAFTLDPNHILDLTEAVRQYAIINLPMKPLCRQDCAGLCFTCGANLNDGGCGCSAPVDSRWSPLLGLLAVNE